MELIPINDSKLKIMLDESDMKELNICDEADCANNETRHAIRRILERAKSQIGFNTEGSEIFVQLYTSRAGGCELFVTKGVSGKPEEKRAMLYNMIFSFDSLDELCTVCRLLRKKGIILTSSAYIGEDGRYYIRLEDTSMSAYTRLDELSFLHEYGIRERTEHISTYLCEHSRTICSQNAVKLLSEF